MPSISAKLKPPVNPEVELLENSRKLDGAYGDAVEKPINKNSARGLRTRQRLIDSTIECLYTLGYYRTSTIQVAKQAGVSRGSMLNQFPTKADLMIGVAEYIAQQRGAAHRKGQEDADSFEEKFRRLVPILWDELKGPTGVARLELMLASRSDPDLAAKFGPLNDKLENTHRRVVWKLTEELGLKSRELSDAAVHLYTAALRGLSIDLLFPGRKATIEKAAVLLECFMLTLIENEDLYVRALAERTPADLTD